MLRSIRRLPNVYSSNFDSCISRRCHHKNGPVVELYRSPIQFQLKVSNEINGRSFRSYEGSSTWKSFIRSKLQAHNSGSPYQSSFGNVRNFTMNPLSQVNSFIIHPKRSMINLTPKYSNFPYKIAMESNPAYFSTKHASTILNPSKVQSWYNTQHIYFITRANLGSISSFSSSSNTPNPKNSSSRTRVGIISSLIGSAVLLGGKTKYLLGALKLTKFASLGSMFITVGTYSIFFGFPYALGMVSLILIHESGHALVMKHYNIPFSPMVFVPFLGATVAMKRTPMNAYQEAMVALGGPVLGTAGALGFAGAAQFTDSQLLYALADFGFMINMFNMLPLGMMDGGRICGALSPYSGLVGLGLGGSLIYMDMISNPIFYLIMMGGAYTTFQRFYYPNQNLPLGYYNITRRERTAITGSYFGLLGLLMTSMAFNQQFKKSPRELEMERMYQRHMQDFHQQTRYQ